MWNNVEMKKLILLEKVIYIVNVNLIVFLYFFKCDYFYFWLLVLIIVKLKILLMRDVDLGIYLKGWYFWKF